MYCNCHDNYAKHYILYRIYENGNKVCIKAFALNFIDVKGSNCALNHGTQLDSYSGCIKTELML